MDIIEEITKIVEKLNSIDSYCNSLTTDLNELDEKTQDLLHYIVNNKKGCRNVIFGISRIIKKI